MKTTIAKMTEQEPQKINRI